MTLSEYAHALRPSLPREAFRPARSRLLWMPVHLAIIVVATMAVAHGWGGWPVRALAPLLIGAGFAGLTFLGHETLHGGVVHSQPLRYLVGSICFAPFCLSPRLWVAWHNRVHHGNANIPAADPDAYPTLDEYQSSRKVRFVVDHLAPGRGRLTGLISLLVGFTGQSAQMLLAGGKRGFLRPHQYRVALGEAIVYVAGWTLLALAVGPLAFVLVYVVPLVIANVIVMSFIFTNHSLSPLGSENDPLAHSLSVTVPRWADWLTLRFGFHVEHHLFPSMSSRHAGHVRDALLARWPERYQSMPLYSALSALHRSPRVYEGLVTLVDPTGDDRQPTLQPRRATLAAALP